MEAKECDPGLEEAVKSIIHAAPRTEIKELHQARVLLVEKYGKEFALEAMENTDAKVADRVLRRLKNEPPSRELVTLYLKEIAKTYGVAWPRGEDGRGGQGDQDDDDEPGDGEKEKAMETPLSTEELSKATPPRDLGPRSPVHVAPPKPTTENLSPKVNLPGPPELKPGSKMAAAKEGAGTGDVKTAAGKVAPVGGKIPDVDELAKRFAALKK